MVELAMRPRAERWRHAMRMEGGQRVEMLREWAGWAHDGQVPERRGEGGGGGRDGGDDWLIWLIRAGRGFGKTRAGAEWVTGLARREPDARIALVGATIEEVRRVMVEGESGLLACLKADDQPRWLRGAGELHWPSGARAYAYSADAPDQLRGPQHHYAWCDEIAKWRRGAAAWDNLLLGLRLGRRPRIVVTTTPRPNVLMRRVIAMPGVRETVGRTRDNPFLPSVFVEGMEAEYAGTRLGRQELDGEMVDDVEGALWTRGVIEACRTGSVPALKRVVVGVDPPATAGGDACGIVAAGLGRDGVAYVLEDASVSGLAPEGWAQAVAACAARWGADRVVAEKNQGGDMVESVLRAADATLAVEPVHASRGKAARAEPVALHYSRGRVRHAGAMPALEDELCGLQAGGGYQGPGRSPDRADACVWALSALLMRPVRAEAGIRTL
jgi:phage terminase large subunit-like protein